MSYFVTVRGEEVETNLTKDAAIKAAKKALEEDKSLGMIQVGIGNRFYMKGERVYTLICCYFYFD